MAYLTRATTKGGRDREAIREEGGFGLAMAIPKTVGGSGEGTNPEQLFALGTSSCFGLAPVAIARKHGVGRAAAETILHEAHEICPYSRATRNNVPVTLELI